jgi:hypothetical protein
LQATFIPPALLGIITFAEAKQPTYDFLFPVSPERRRPESEHFVAREVEYVCVILKLFVFAPAAPPKHPPLAPRRWATLSRPGNGTSCACFFTSLRASPLRSESGSEWEREGAGAGASGSGSDFKYYVFPQPPRRCSGTSAATLALGRGHTVRACFSRWTPRAIPNLVASSPAVSKLYWGEN